MRRVGKLDLTGGVAAFAGEADNSSERLGESLGEHRGTAVSERGGRAESLLSGAKVCRGSASPVYCWKRVSALVLDAYWQAAGTSMLRSVDSRESRENRYFAQGSYQSGFCPRL
jgi:hypothetical protein